jgi:superfamily II DNA or RNA helicase
VIVDRILTLDYAELTEKQWAKLTKGLTYQAANGDIVMSYQAVRDEVRIPRGAWFLMPDTIEYRDNRVKPKMPELEFALTLDDTEKDERFAGQIAAVEAMFREEQGIVVRPPGTGKTQIATAFATKCKTRTLVLVHTEDILQQWVSSVERAVPSLKGKVGVIRGQTEKVGHITIATVQTLHRSYVKRGPKWWAQWGCVIADEGHHVAATTWENVLNTLPAYYRFAFTASPTRADGMHPSMRFIIGPVIHRQQFSSPIDLKVKTVTTDFNFMYRGPFDYGRLLNKIETDEERNLQIAEVVDAEIARGNTVLVLSRRIDHLGNIADAMQSECEILTGERSRSDRIQILDEFRSGTVNCILATQLADEALDVQRLNRVCLVFPGKHEGRIIQQIGRALRQHPDKQDAVIYDFVDRRVGVLRKQALKRKQTYAKLKIKVESTKKLKLGRAG